jgi:hypothetical protein
VAAARIGRILLLEKADTVEIAGKRTHLQRLAIGDKVLRRISGCCREEETQR